MFSVAAISRLPSEPRKHAMLPRMIKAADAPAVKRASQSRLSLRLSNQSSPNVHALGAEAVRSDWVRLGSNATATALASLGDRSQDTDPMDPLDVMAGCMACAEADQTGCKAGGCVTASTPYDDTAVCWCSDRYELAGGHNGIHGCPEDFTACEDLEPEDEVAKLPRPEGMKPEEAVGKLRSPEDMVGKLKPPIVRNEHG